MTSKSAKNGIYIFLAILAIVLVAVLVPILAGKVTLTNTQTQKNSAAIESQTKSTDSIEADFRDFQAKFNGIQETAVPLNMYLHGTKSKVNERFDVFLRKHIEPFSFGTQETGRFDDYLKKQ